jgi:hypothetical protein
MKKNYLITLLMTVAIGMIANNSLAQGMYANLNVGYGFGKSTMNLESLNFYNSTQGSNSVTDEQIFLSLGKGFNFGGTIGDMFSEHVGAELGINYLMGGKAKAKDEYPGGTTEYKLYANMLRFIPAVVIAAGGEGINPYAKFGVVISTGSAKYEWEDNDVVITISKEKYSGGIALGFMGAVGVIFPLNDKLGIFAEINTVNQSYAPKKGELTEASYNGKDMLPDLTTSQKEIEFVDKITTEFEGNDPPTSEPTKVLKQKLPLGSVGIQVGAQIKF